MFVRKIRSNKGIIEVGKYGIDRIDVHDDGTATYYTAGGNIFTVKVKEVLNADGIVSNSRTYIDHVAKRDVALQHPFSWVYCHYPIVYQKLKELI